MRVAEEFGDGSRNKLDNPLFKDIEKDCDKILAFVKDLLVMNGINYNDTEKNIYFKSIQQLIQVILDDINNQKDKRSIISRLYSIKTECEKLNHGAVAKLEKPIRKGVELPAFNAVIAAILRVEKNIIKLSY